jgi:hypothetical protein
MTKFFVGSFALLDIGLLELIWSLEFDDWNFLDEARNSKGVLLGMARVDFSGKRHGQKSDSHCGG